MSIYRRTARFFDSERVGDQWPVHLTERVLPRVPIRHWICSLPWGLRALLGYDHKLCGEVVTAFMAEVSRSLRFRAKRELGLASVAQAHTGAVVAVQRTDGSHQPEAERAESPNHASGYAGTRPRPPERE